MAMETGTGSLSELASMGGKARRDRLTAARRGEIARMGGEARRRSLTERDRKKIARDAVATRWEARRIGRRIEDNFLKIPIYQMLRSLHV